MPSEKEARLASLEDRQRAEFNAYRVGNTAYAEKIEEIKEALRTVTPGRKSYFTSPGLLPHHARCGVRLRKFRRQKLP
jgi:hypothetical protein